MINKVEICGINFTKQSVLKESEIKKLFLSMRNGDNESREAFIKVNLSIILNVIKRFNSSDENVDNLFHAGYIGLIKSIDNYNLSNNVKFSSYALPIIIGEIRNYLHANNSIRVSKCLKDIAYKALQIRDKLVVENNKEPKISQIAKELNIPREEVVFALDVIQDPVSLFEPLYNHGKDVNYEMDQIGDIKNSENSWLENICMKEVMKKISSREKLILELRFFDGRTQMEVADEIGISQLQVSQLEKIALHNIRKYI